ncbi:MAG TPA: hypothetical protein VMF87_25145 [Streptosporangiaceae bacterium]|nr:hypothetical protein [Streptosporangiaceae bacterium]
MSFATKARRLPGRLAAGAFTLNSGLSKWNADDQTAAALHAMASGPYPFLTRMKAKDFARLLSVTEIGLGAAMLLPVVPATLAGAGLAAYSSALLGLYLRTEGTRLEDGFRPTPEGTALAKDVWLLGIGLGLVVDGLSEAPASA